MKSITEKYGGEKKGERGGEEGWKRVEKQGESEEGKERDEKEEGKEGEKEGGCIFIWGTFSSAVYKDGAALEVFTGARMAAGPEHSHPVATPA